MTICREWSVVKRGPQTSYAKPLLCRSWSCEFCRPMRKLQLMARAGSGLPERFITLTVNPRIGSSPEERLRLLAHAWRNVIKRLRRWRPQKEFEYLAIAEATDAGEPHLHILLRGGYIPQKLLSEFMRDFIESPIVDIRRIRDSRKAVAYVAKYVTKAPLQFGSAKRYWFSRGFEPPADALSHEGIAPDVRWNVERRHINDVLTEWANLGLVFRSHRGDTIIAWDPARGPP